MRTIAIEEHFLAAGYEKLAPAFQAAKLADAGATRLRDMDAHGIDLQVLSHTALDFGRFVDDEAVRFAQDANNQLAAIITAHPDRFAGFATLPMTKPVAAVQELERAVRSLRLKGAIIHGTTNGRFLDDPSFQPLLEQAVALDVPIYLHPALPPPVVRDAYYANLDTAISSVLAAAGWGWHSEVGIHVLRMILAGVFDRLPGLRIIIGHMGEMLPFMFDRIDNVLTPVARHLQRPVPEYLLHNIFITTSGFFTNPPLMLTLQIMGIDRVMFSVDYPYSTNAQGRAFLDNVPLRQKEKEKFSHLNVERLLKLV